MTPAAVPLEWYLLGCDSRAVGTVTCAMAFAMLLEGLPEPIKKWVVESGFDSADAVANSVTPEYMRSDQGAAVIKPVDVVFVEAVAAALPEVVKPATPARAKVLDFFRKCYTEPAQEAEGAVQALQVRDAECEEYYQLMPDYRRDRLEKLNLGRQHEVEEGRLPSARLWGRYERLKRTDKEYQPLLPEKVQSEAVGRRKPMSSMMAPVKDGQLGWRLPPLCEPAPGTLEELETWCYIVENLLFLVGWCTSVAPLETFHNRFWSRVRANRVARPGYRGLTVQEYLDAYMTCQAQWKKASRNSDNLDEAVKASLPPDNDELDVRLALAPRLAGQAPNAHEPGTGKRLLAVEDGKAFHMQGDGEPQPKFRRLTRGERQKRKLAALTQELEEERAGQSRAKGFQKGGKAAGKGKAKGTEKEGTRKGKGEWCKHMTETGACPFGDKCWFRHV